MKRRTITLISAFALVCGLTAISASPAAADNCRGQSTSYAAQGNDISPFVSANGIGNVAKANAVSTKDAVGYVKFVVCG